MHIVGLELTVPYVGIEFIFWWLAQGHSAAVVHIRELEFTLPVISWTLELEDLNSLSFHDFPKVTQLALLLIARLDLSISLFLVHYLDF